MYNTNTLSKQASYYKDLMQRKKRAWAGPTHSDKNAIQLHTSTYHKRRRRKERLRQWVSPPHAHIEATAHWMLVHICPAYGWCLASKYSPHLTCNLQSLNRWLGCIWMTGPQTFTPFGLQCDLHPAWAIWELCINSWCIWIMECMALKFSSSLDLHYTIWFITPCSNHIFWRYSTFGNIFKRSYNMNRNTTWLTPCSCLQMEIQYGSHPARTRWDANWWETNRAQFLCLVLL